MRTCKKCKKELAETDFRKRHRNGVNGNKYPYLMNICISCEKDENSMYAKSKKNKPDTIRDLDGEEWRDVRGYEGHYQVSNLGRVKSVERNITSRVGIDYLYYSKLLKFQLTDRGYVTVKLCKECVCMAKRVNILVAKAFIANPENKPHVNHKKGIKQDNRASELEWNTISENIKHSFNVLGRKVPSGEDNKMSMKITVYCPDGKKVDVVGLNNVGRTFNLSPAAIHRTLNGKANHHKGYFFKYKTA